MTLRTVLLFMFFIMVISACSNDTDPITNITAFPEKGADPKVSQQQEGDFILELTTKNNTCFYGFTFNSYGIN
jgi:PBP1b-binding outer membrane lipoprotein LpoB